MTTNSVIAAMQAADPNGSMECKFLRIDSSYVSVASGDIATATIVSGDVLVLNVNHPSTLPPA